MNEQEMLQHLYENRAVAWEGAIEELEGARAVWFDGTWYSLCEIEDGKAVMDAPSQVALPLEQYNDWRERLRIFPTVFTVESL